ncbi:MAG: phage major capsid protein [Bacteroidales bacterium]
MALVYGSTGQPAQSTFNYDALIATSLAAYRNQLVDNVSSSNSFFKMIKWDSEDGGLYVAQDLMYGLGVTDTYSGYDELPLTPTNGITQAQFQWAQAVTPISISGEEIKKNKKRIVNLLSSKLEQASIGMKEFWAKAFLQGAAMNGSGSLTSPYTGSTGATFVTPLPALVYYEPSNAWPSLSIGGIDQNTNVWWRNKSAASTATTKEAFMQEILNMYNNCSKGPGGPPDLILCDQVTWELVHASYRTYFQNTAMSDGNFPFPNLKFFNAKIVWDEYVPDVANNVVDTSTKGTMYFLNTQFFRAVYESDTNFVTTDQVRPANQDAFYRHILWMGTVTISNRRKQGVLGNIARTLS